MFLSDVNKIIDLNRSVLDTSELDSLKSQKAGLESKQRALKEPKTEEAKKRYLDKASKLSKRILELDEEIQKAQEQNEDNVKKGKYDFRQKVYVERADYLNASVRPPFKFQWNRYEPRTNYKEVRDWQIKFGASFVTTKDPWWPEGVPPDGEGKYVFGDSVLMKIPLRQYLEEKERNRLRAERATASKMREFKTTLERRAGKDAVDEDLIREHF